VCIPRWNTSTERLCPMSGKIFFPRCDLQALSSSCSDHAPLLSTDPKHRVKGRFLFRSFWTCCDGFMEVIQRAWCCPLRNASLFARLDWLFRNTSRFLKSWSDRFISNVRFQLALANEVVARLEAASDHRQLGVQEESLRKELKLKALGLSSLQRTIARQQSCVLWLREDSAISFAPWITMVTQLCQKKPRRTSCWSSSRTSCAHCRCEAGESSWICLEYLASA
jgi:hypothetical protein